MNITARPVAVSMMAVPRSGWCATRTAGRPIIPNGINSFHDSRASSLEVEW